MHCGQTAEFFWTIYWYFHQPLSEVPLYFLLNKIFAEISGQEDVNAACIVYV